MGKKKVLGKAERRKGEEKIKPLLQELEGLLKKQAEKQEEKLKETEKGKASDVEEEPETDEGEEPENFDDIFDSGESERKAPLLRVSSERQEPELENMLEDERGSEKERKEKEDEEENRYDFAKPKYSFDDEETMEELRHVVIKEMPSLIERTSEAGEMHNPRMNEQMLEHSDVEEYSVRYVPVHKQGLLEETEEIKGRKVDVKKYRKER